MSITKNNNISRTPNVKMRVKVTDSDKLAFYNIPWITAVKSFIAQGLDYFQELKYNDLILALEFKPSKLRNEKNTFPKNNLTVVILGSTVTSKRGPKICCSAQVFNFKIVSYAPFHSKCINMHMAYVRVENSAHV